MARIVIITGTPGVGKTFLASNIAKSLQVSCVDLGPFVKRLRLYSAIDRARGSLIADERRVRKALAKELVDGGVVATHFLGDVFPRNVDGIAIVLRLDPRLLWRRLRARGWTRSKAWENVESELLDVCYFDAVKTLGERKVSEIDTSRKPRFQVLKEALMIVSDKAKRRGKRVDWLGSYDPVELSRGFGALAR